MGHRNAVGAAVVAILVAVGPMITGCTRQQLPDVEETAEAGPGAEVGQQAPPDRRLTFQEALDRARSRYPDAPAIEVELEREGDEELLEVEFIVEGEVREVYMDPVTGEIVAEEVEELSDDERAMLPALAEALGTGEVTLDDAIRLAESHHPPDEIEEIELELHGDRLVVEVEMGPLDEVEHIFDARTGEALGTEDEVAGE